MRVTRGTSITNLRDQLGVDLEQCMTHDAAVIRRRLRGARAPDRAFLDELRRRAEASIERRRRRAARRPVPRFAADLPIGEARADIAEAIRTHPVVVVCGETGSGKSTQLPQICLDAGRGDAGLIGHTQPRRIAARSIAARVAEELGESVGASVGYTVRFQDRTDPDGFVKLMTDGILLAEIQRDRRLDRYDTIIIDEAHERSLNIDFLLGYLKQLLPRRPDLRIVITSATIDPERFSTHFGDAPIIAVGGRTYPVDLRYRPPGGAGTTPVDRDIARAVVEAIAEIDAEEPGDVLVFLAGEREIRDLAKHLRRHGPPGAEIMPLYARLSPAEQQRVFQPHGKRRIILATNVAETSLTVPGIRAVIDPGFARISRYSPRTKVQRLPIEAISQASAQQRAGRCGRVGPGVCIRLYDEEDFAQREEFTPPEILRTNLASVILRMEAIGLGRVEDFPFLEPPRRSMIRDGYETLQELGAINDAGRLTRLGRRLARLPIDPRLGRMLLAADDEGCVEELLVIASVLEAQDPRIRPADQTEAADAAHRSLGDRNSDFMSYMKLWEHFHAAKGDRSWSQLRTWCTEHFLSFVRMREWLDLHRQLRALAIETGLQRNEQPASPDRVHRAVLAGLLSNVGRLREKREYAGARGGSAFIFPGSVLAKASPKWIVAAEVVETTRRFARCVARIRPDWIERVGSHLVQRGHTDPHWDARAACVMASERVTLYGLEIVARRPVNYGPIGPVYARDLFIHHALVAGEYETDAPFFRHNHALIKSIRAEEARRRRRDLLVDTHQQYDFYDRLLPPEVYSGKAFERWRRRAERRNPRVLFLSRDDLLVPGAEPTDATAFPSELVADDLRLPLRYVHDPAADDDGITVEVPAGLLGQLPAQRLAWLVPGRLEEKVVALLRSLPKSIRRELVPLPDVARRAVAALHFGEGDLLSALSHAILRATGVDVPYDAWSPDEVPAPLRMNVRVRDQAGEIIAEGRELDAVRRAGRDVAETAATEGGDDVPLPVGERFTVWTLGVIPPSVEIRRGGHVVRAYPALVDSGDAACLELRSDPAAAMDAHRTGLRRLFVLRAGEALDVHVQHLPGRSRMQRLFASLGTGAALDDHLALRTVDAAFLAQDVDVRDATAFEDRFEAGWDRLWDAARTAGEVALATLEAHHEVRLALAEKTAPVWGDLVEDVTAQVDRLVTPTFIAEVPAAWWPHLPRFLKAAVRRVERGGDPGRDRARSEAIDVWWMRYAARRDDLEAQGRTSAALDHFRWLLEELRVSVFAQELGTSVPVSEKRLVKAWEAVGREG